jgi:cytochrome c5
MRSFLLMPLLALSMIAAAARADEPPIALKKAPGLDVVEGFCGACHSLDYIQMNSPFPSAALWDAEVKKMINAFGAPIPAADAKTITDYLVKNYGS